MKNFILSWTLQGYASIISLAGAFIVIAVVIFLMATSGKSEDNASVKHKVYKIRGRYFFGLCIFLVAILLITLRLLPYPDFQNKPDEFVTVVGQQWSWKMAIGKTDKSPAEFTGGNEITLPVNKNIEFLVTSMDVNHSFGIYDDKGVLVKQVQAMPQYTNELQYVFTRKGKYIILCLEYCGLAHPYMEGTIQIN